MNATFEKPVTEEVKGVIENAAAMLNIDSMAVYLKTHLKGWFIYKGGSYIAIHRNSRVGRSAIIS